MLKCSVVLSTYNGEKYIYEQLESLLKQSRMIDEVIISDDCSTDNTLNIIKQYTEDNNLFHWKVYQNKVNKGWRKNFIDGMKMATGDLIFPCDQDDIWRNDKLEIMEKIMIEHEEIGVLVSNYLEFYDNGKQFVRPHCNTKRLHKIKVKKKFMDVEYPGCTYCVRKDFFEKIVGYWQEIIPHDGLIWRLGMFANLLYAYDDSLIHQRKHKDSTFSVEARSMRNIQAKKGEIVYVSSVIAAIKAFLQNEGIFNKECEHILKEAECWGSYREKLYKTRNPFWWLYLLKYYKYYPTMRKYILDLYVVLFTR